LTQFNKENVDICDRIIEILDKVKKALLFVDPFFIDIKLKIGVLLIIYYETYKFKSAKIIYEFLIKVYYNDG